MGNSIPGTLSERAKYIMHNHPKLMNDIVHGKCLNKTDKKLLADIITKFNTTKS